MRKIYQVFIFIGLTAMISACATKSTYIPGSPHFMQTASEARAEGIRYRLGQGVIKDEARAFNSFLYAAKLGDAASQNEVAYMYAAGVGTTQNYTNALKWYQKASSQGLASAQYSLGTMYYYGLGTKKNRQTASKWFALSAKQGFIPAVSMLKKRQQS